MDPEGGTDDGSKREEGVDDEEGQVGAAAAEEEMGSGVGEGVFD